MKTIITTLTLAATLLTATPIQPVQASIQDESISEMANRKCNEAVTMANAIYQRMDGINLALVSKSVKQDMLNFGAKAIVQIEEASSNCYQPQQVEMKSEFLRRWDVWMDQLLVRDSHGRENQ